MSDETLNLCSHIIREYSIVSSEYTCTECKHDFDSIPEMNEEIRCPRCGSESVEPNPYLLGTCNVEGLTPEDYFAVALKP